MDKVFKAFTRTKHLTTAEVDETKLHRCLSTFDLTAIGVGSTLGAGAYVVAAQVAKHNAGPGVIISFPIAAVTALLSGLCYAEFGARVPKAGSAYIYSYVTIGELCAFVIGWNMLLEYVFGAAAVAKAWSGFFNSLCNDCIREFFIKHLGSMKLSWMSDYPDILAVAFIIVLTIIVICGVAESSAINWFFTVINLGVIVFVTAAGLVFADLKNWDNFTPLGFQGVMSGAATAFFAFAGFDGISTLGEEAKTPRKAIPRSIIACVLIVFVAYECVCVTLTLMMPYDQLPEASALATVFDHKGFLAAKYIVSIGAICGLSSTTLGSLLPIPRILYAMASDQLVFSIFANVNERTGTPILACIIGGLLTSLLALFLDLHALVEMLSIGTLLAYTIVSICAIMLRYKPGSVIEESAQVDDEFDDPGLEDDTDMTQHSEELPGPSDFATESEEPTASNHENFKERRDDMRDNSPIITDPFYSNKDFSNSPSILTRVGKRILGRPLDSPTEDSYLVVKIALAIFILHSIGLQCCLIWGLDRLISKDPVVIICFILFLMWMLVAIDVIARQPESKNKLAFKVPFLPFLPLTAVFINIFLLLELSHMTWIRFAIWMVLGMVIYLFYGVKHSSQNEDNNAREEPSYIELESEDENSWK